MSLSVYFISRELLLCFLKNNWATFDFKDGVMTERALRATVKRRPMIIDMVSSSLTDQLNRIDTTFRR